MFNSGSAFDQHHQQPSEAEMDAATSVDEQVPTLPPALTDELFTTLATGSGSHDDASVLIVGCEFHSTAASRLIIFPRKETRGGGGGGGQQQQQHQGGSKLFDFSWDVIVGGMNQLLHSWHSIFTQLQVSSQTLNPRYNRAASLDQWHAHLLTVSRAYRAELESCLMEAAEQMQGGQRGQLKQEIKQELKEKNIDVGDYQFQLILLETCKSLFHLLEIFYLDPHLNLTSQLIDWIHRTLVSPVVELNEEEQSAGYDPNTMHDTDSYWSCIYRMLLQGRLYEAYTLLKTCDELFDAESIYRPVMDQLLQCIETVPAIAFRDRVIKGKSSQASNKSRGAAQMDEHANIPIDQFVHSFREWRKNVDSILNSDLLTESPHPHIEACLQVLLGDEPILLDCAENNYLEFFISILIYVKPHIQNSKQELSQILSDCMEKCEQRWRDQRKAEKEEMQQEDGGAEMEAFDADDESLYTPIDTLRYHLISSDIISALNVMNSMIDLRFFMAHVVNLLDAHGEILHLEQTTDGQFALPLRLNHSSINDNITLKEYYLIAYGENLEAAASTGTPNASDFWQLAVDYYAACPENGRGYLTQLLRKQALTISLPTHLAPNTQQQQKGLSVFQQAGVTPTTYLQTKKVHKLLAIAEKYDLKEEYNHVVEMTGNIALRLGRDALVSVGVTGSPFQASALQSSWFGQAAFWFNLIQPVNETQTNLHTTMTWSKLEAMTELLLDQLLLNGATITSQQQELALQSIQGVLSHTPSQAILAFELLDSTSNPTGFSPLLTFLSAYHSYRLFDSQRLRTIREIQLEKTRVANEPHPDETKQKEDEDQMGDVQDGASPPAAAQSTSLTGTSSNLIHLLSLHSYHHSQTQAILLLILRHAPLLLAQQRKYWLVLIQELVNLSDSQTSLNQLSTSTNGFVTPLGISSSTLVSWYDLGHPSVDLPNTLPPPSSTFPISLVTLTHLQRLITTILHSSTAELFSRVVGGVKAVQRLQQRLTRLTQQTSEPPTGRLQY